MVTRDGRSTRRSSLGSDSATPCFGIEIAVKRPPIRTPAAGGGRAPPACSMTALGRWCPAARGGMLQDTCQSCESPMLCPSSCANTRALHLAQVRPKIPGKFAVSPTSMIK